MGRILDLLKYPIKGTPVAADYVIGTNSVNGDTVNFRVDSFASGTGNILQNNLWKRIKVGAVNATFDNLQPVADIINNYNPPIEVLEDELAVFEALIFDGLGSSSFSVLAVNGKGKGTYGVGGTETVVPADFIVLERNSNDVFVPDTDDPNANVEDLGEIGTTPLLDIINAANPAYVIEAGTNWYFEFTRSGNRELYGFQGANGTYGLGELQMISSDLFVIFEEGVTGQPQDLQSVTEQGGVTDQFVTFQSLVTFGSGTPFSTALIFDGGLGRGGGLVDTENGVEFLCNSVVKSGVPLLGYGGEFDPTDGTLNGLAQIITDNNVLYNDRILRASDSATYLGVEYVEGDFAFYNSFTQQWEKFIDNNQSFLTRIDEGNGEGIIIKDRVANNYGNVGLNALDLSFSSTASGTRGATGAYSAAFGLNATASGTGSFAFGGTSMATGTASFALPNSTAGGSNSFAGGNASATVNNAFAFGSSGTIASGVASIAIGFAAKAYSYAEIAVGSNMTTYAPTNVNAFDSKDRAFIVGIGNVTPKDAFCILKSGEVGIGIDNFETNATTELLQVAGEAKVDNLKITSNGTYADDAAAGVGGLEAGQVYNTATGVLMIKL